MPTLSHLAVSGDNGRSPPFPAFAGDSADPPTDRPPGTAAGQWRTRHPDRTARRRGQARSGALAVERLPGQGRRQAPPERPGHRQYRERGGNPQPATATLCRRAATARSIGLACGDGRGIGQRIGPARSRWLFFSQSPKPFRGAGFRRFSKEFSTETVDRRRHGHGLRPTGIQLDTGFGKPVPIGCRYPLEPDRTSVHDVQSTTYATDGLPSMALDSGNACRHDGIVAIMRMAGGGVAYQKDALGSRWRCSRSKCPLISWFHEL